MAASEGDGEGESGGGGQGSGSEVRMGGRGCAGRRASVVAKQNPCVIE